MGSIAAASEGSVQVEYSRDALETIRKRAWKGLVASPSFGIGVGGLLLGVREHACIRILDSIDIPCAHSMGPSFNLTADEKRETLDLIAAAGATDVSGKVQVIGWYCSKTRGCATLNEADLKLHAELFPGSWQIALVVRPSVVDPMQAAFFFQGGNGGLVKGGECEVDEWWCAPEGEPEAAAPEAETEVRAQDGVSAALEQAETELSDLLSLSSSVAGPFATDTLVGPPVPASVPDPETQTLSPGARKLGWALAAGAALSIGMLANWWSKSRPRTRQK
jgi:hypothetical protein